MNKGKVSVSPKMVRYICLLLILLSIGGCIYLGVLYNGDQSDQDDLEDQIAQNEPLKKILEDDRANKDLDKLLDDANDRLVEVEALIPAEKDSTDVIEMLMEMTKESGIDMPPLAGRVSQATTTTIAGNEYYVITFNLTPTGSYDQVLDFINLLENGEMENITLEYTALVDSGSSWSANLSGVYYSRVAEIAEEGSPSAKSS